MLSCRIHWDRSRTNLFSLACISFLSFCRFCVKKYLKVSKWDFPTSRRWLLHTRSMEKMRLSLPIRKYDDLVLVSARNSVYVCYVSNRAQVCIIVKCALVSSIRMKNHKSHQDWFHREYSAFDLIRFCPDFSAVISRCSRFWGFLASWWILIDDIFLSRRDWEFSDFSLAVFSLIYDWTFARSVSSRLKSIAENMKTTTAQFIVSIEDGRRAREMWGC